MSQMIARQMYLMMVELLHWMNNLYKKIVL